MRFIPKTMSTQHPDNALQPKWVSGDVIAGEDEIYETFYVYSVLGIHEQMWDWEGKDADPHVVRKLLEKFPEFFAERILGKDFYLTYRIPNPNVEKDEKKKFAEALETIPSSYDIAMRFYGEKTLPPIFEVILPLTRSHIDLLRVVNYYKKIVIGKESIRVIDEDAYIREWIGNFHPKNIEIIPLIEDKESILSIEEIVGKFIKITKPAYLRVFIARSDPALNYGLPAAVLLSKIALYLLWRLKEKEKVEIFPIIGAGPPPFRGNLNPHNINKFMEEYEGYWTVTVQSAFKYDYSEYEVKEAVKKLNDRETLLEDIVESLINLKKDAENIVEKFCLTYRSRIEHLHGIINALAELVPSRRARKLHIGLFGYTRETKGIKLPRAIRFTAVLYSLGIPPEILGLTTFHNLTEKEQNLLESLYVNLKHDLESAAKSVCWESLNMLLGDKEIYEKITKKYRIAEGLAGIMEDIEFLEENFGIKTGAHSLSERKYSNIVNNILITFAEGNYHESKKYIVEAAKLRKFLG